MCSPTAVRRARRRARNVVVAVVHGLHVQVDAVEPLVDEAAALRDDALPLAEIAELEGARALAPVADAKPADPGKDLEAGSGRAAPIAGRPASVPGCGQEGCPLEPKGIRCGKGVQDAVAGERREQRVHLRRGVVALQPAVLEPDGVPVLVEGVGRLVADGGEGEVEGPRGGDEAREGAGLERRSESAHSASRRRTDAAAWVRPWVRLTRARSAPSARRRSMARADNDSRGGPPRAARTSMSAGPIPSPRRRRGRALGGQPRRETPLGVGLRRRVGPLRRREHARSRASRRPTSSIGTTSRALTTTPSARCTRSSVAWIMDAVSHTLRAATIAALDAVPGLVHGFEQRLGPLGLGDPGGGPAAGVRGAGRFRAPLPAPAGPRDGAPRGALGGPPRRGRRRRRRPRPPRGRRDGRLPSGSPRGPRAARRRGRPRRLARHGGRCRAAARRGARGRRLPRRRHRGRTRPRDRRLLLRGRRGAAGGLRPGGSAFFRPGPRGRAAPRRPRAPTRRSSSGRGFLRAGSTTSPTARSATPIGTIPSGATARAPAG